MPARRPFNTRLGDRIAKAPQPQQPLFGKPQMAQMAAQNLSDAMDYAVLRAQQTGKRQYLYKGRGKWTHNWWLVLVKDEDIG